MDLTKKSWFCVSILLSVTVLQALESDRNGNMYHAPVMCLMEKGETDEIKVYCRHLSLSEVPTVATAAVSYNNITKLKHESFKSYKDLITLLLKISNIQQIDRDAFHSLKNLESIDISENIMKRSFRTNEVMLIMRNVTLTFDDNRQTRRRDKQICFMLK
jgi:hypothetical protein